MKRVASKVLPVPLISRMTSEVFRAYTVFVREYGYNSSSGTHQVISSDMDDHSLFTLHPVEPEGQKGHNIIG